MLPLVAIAFAVASGVAVLEFVSARALERIPSVATEKFPEIDRELLGKFSSFDSEPGWGTQPNREKQKGTGDHLPGEDVRSVASSVARVLSVWKHYQEFGNIVAVKPSYVLANDGLQRIESPVDEKGSPLGLESKADFLEKDEHLRYAAYTAGKEERRARRSIPGIDSDRAQMQSALLLQQPRVRYHERLFETHEPLFDALTEELADERDFELVFRMGQQPRCARYESEHGPIDGVRLDRLHDLTTHLLPADGDVESLYVDRGGGGHYSPETNAATADVLADIVEARTITI